MPTVEPWVEGCVTDVTLEGRARPVVDHELMEHLAVLWGTRWDGRWSFTVADGAFRHDHGGVSYVYELVPSKVLSFAKSPFAQTRHRFVEDDRTGAS